MIYVHGYNAEENADHNFMLEFDEGTLRVAQIIQREKEGYKADFTSVYENGHPGTYLSKLVRSLIYDNTITEHFDLLDTVGYFSITGDSLYFGLGTTKENAQQALHIILNKR